MGIEVELLPVLAKWKQRGVKSGWKPGEPVQSCSSPCIKQYASITVAAGRRQCGAGTANRGHRQGSVMCVDTVKESCIPLLGKEGQVLHRHGDVINHPQMQS
eukprot:3356419-Rhodomonas_salina.3